MSREPEEFPEDDENEPLAGQILPAQAGLQDTPTPYARVRRLRTVRDVSMELSTVYSMARRGQMTWQNASRAAFVLRTAGDMLIAHDLEARLQALEGTTQEAK